jgi:hypothetical protein
LDQYDQAFDACRRGVSILENSLPDTFLSYFDISS